MKKRFLAGLLALFLAVFLAAPVSADTLNAIPAWPDGAIYGVANIESPDEVFRTIVDSTVFQLGAAMEPDMGMLGEWLKKFPVEAASIVVGMTDKGFSLQAAARFNESKKELLQKLAEGKGEEGDLDLLIDNPVPGMLILAPFEGNLYAVVADGVAAVLLSVEDDMILFGFGEEDIKAARDALADPAKRMNPARNLPQRNFIYFQDNGMMAEEILAASEGVLKEAAGSLMAEIGFGLSEKGFDLSIFTNFAKTFGLDKTEKEIVPLAKDELVLAGGGKPWLTMAGRVILEKRHFDMIREAADGGDYDAQEIVGFLEQLKVMGLTENALISILQSVGMVLGGDANYSGLAIPGGYLYTSGEKEWVELLLPLVEAIVNESGMPFEPLAIPGWQALYVLKEPVSALLGIRDGVAFAGILNAENIEAAPELNPEVERFLGENNATFFFNIDAGVVRRIILEMLDPANPLAAMFLADDDDFLEALPFLFEGLKATAAFQGINMSVSGTERLDFSMLTAEPDAGQLAAIDELAAKWDVFLDEMEDDDLDELEEEEAEAAPKP